MAISGTTRSVMSEKVLKGASEEKILDAITNANEEQIKNDKEVSKKK